MGQQSQHVLDRLFEVGVVYALQQNRIHIEPALFLLEGAWLAHISADGYDGIVDLFHFASLGEISEETFDILIDNLEGGGRLDLVIALAHGLSLNI